MLRQMRTIYTPEKLKAGVFIYFFSLFCFCPPDEWSLTACERWMLGDSCSFSSGYCYTGYSGYLLELVPVQVKELRSGGEVVVKRGLQQNNYCLGMVVVEGEVWFLVNWWTVLCISKQARIFPVFFYPVPENTCLHRLLERLCRDNSNNVVGKTGHYKQYLCINQFTVNLKPSFSFSFKVESKLGLQIVETLYKKQT